MKTGTKRDAKELKIYDVNIPDTPFFRGFFCTHATPHPTIIISDRGFRITGRSHRDRVHPIPFPGELWGEPGTYKANYLKETGYHSGYSPLFYLPTVILHHVC